jgi:hypothetical protein
VLSRLMIGNNVMRVQVQGAKERLVAALATTQAGYITATEDGARSRESLKNQHPLVADHSGGWHPLTHLARTGLLPLLLAGGTSLTSLDVKIRG